MQNALRNVRFYNSEPLAIRTECSPSATVLGNNVYCLSRKGTHCIIAVFDLDIAKPTFIATTGDDGYKAPSIAQYEGNLYVGFGGENTQLNLSSVRLGYTEGIGRYPWVQLTKLS